MLTLRSVFHDLDESRLSAGFSIDCIAKAVGVAPLTYKKWRRGVVPRAERETRMLFVTEAVLMCITWGEVQYTGRTRKDVRLRSLYLEQAMAIIRRENTANNKTADGTRLRGAHRNVRT